MPRTRTLSDAQMEASHRRLADQEARRQDRLEQARTEAELHKQVTGKKVSAKQAQQMADRLFQDEQKHRCRATTAPAVIAFHQQFAISISSSRQLVISRSQQLVIGSSIGAHIASSCTVNS